MSNKPFITESSINQFRSDILKGVDLKDYSDVTLKVSGKSFFAHKVILALRSTYFADLFKNESIENEVNLDKELFQDSADSFQVSTDSFEILLKYLYNGALHITHENCLDMYTLCRKFNLKSAEEVCNEFLDKLRTGSDVCGLITCAYLRNEPELYRQCMKSLEEKTQNCLVSDMLYSLPEKVLVEILKSEKITCTEKDLFDAVIRWWGANKDVVLPGKSKEEQDKYLLNTFLYYIRYPLMKPDDLVELERMKLLPDDYIMDAFRHHACGSIAILALKDDETTSSDIYADEKFRTRARGESLMSFEWSDKKKGTHMVVTNGVTVEIKALSISSYQTILGNKPCYDTAITLFEVVIDNALPSSHIMVGIATGKTSLKTWLGQTKDGWSYFGYNGTKYHGGTSPGYASNTKFGKGDIIGVKFDPRKTGTLCFYKNGQPLGVAFDNILDKAGKNEIYPAVSLRTTGDKITLRTDADMKYKSVYANYINDDTK